MHVKINIPPMRGTHSRGYRFPDLKMPNKHYTVPLEKLLLKEEGFSYEESVYDNVASKYVDEPKSIQRYWLRCPEVILEWAEIHYAEYARLSKIMMKLNLTEIAEHNKKAQSVGATECVFSSTDVRAFYRDSITEQLKEMEEEQSHI